MTDLSALRRLLRAAGITQAQAAARIGVDRPSLNLLLNGRRRPNALVACRLADLERAAAAQVAELVEGVRHA